jgi:hypothetical protein
MPLLYQLTEWKSVFFFSGLHNFKKKKREREKVRVYRDCALKARQMSRILIKTSVSQM